MTDAYRTNTNKQGITLETFLGDPIADKYRIPGKPSEIIERYLERIDREPLPVRNYWERRLEAERKKDDDPYVNIVAFEDWADCKTNDFVKMHFYDRDVNEKILDDNDWRNFVLFDQDATYVDKYNLLDAIVSIVAEVAFNRMQKENSLVKHDEMPRAAAIDKERKKSTKESCNKKPGAKRRNILKILAASEGQMAIDKDVIYNKDGLSFNEFLKEHGIKEYKCSINVYDRIKAYAGKTVLSYSSRLRKQLKEKSPQWHSYWEDRYTEEKEGAEYINIKALEDWLSLSFPEGIISEFEDFGELDCKHPEKDAWKDCIFVNKDTVYVKKDNNIKLLEKFFPNETEKALKEWTERRQEKEQQKKEQQKKETAEERQQRREERAAAKAEKERLKIEAVKSTYNLQIGEQAKNRFGLNAVIIDIVPKEPIQHSEVIVDFPQLKKRVSVLAREFYDKKGICTPLWNYRNTKTHTFEFRHYHKAQIIGMTENEIYFSAIADDGEKLVVPLTVAERI